MLARTFVEHSELASQTFRLCCELSGSRESRVIHDGWTLARGAELERPTAPTQLTRIAGLRIRCRELRLVTQRRRSRDSSSKFVCGREATAARILPDSL